MKLTDLFRQSRLNGRAEYVRKEEEKRGVLRAGSSGIISEKNEVAGHCARKAHLRSLGIELDPPTEDKLIMFDLGFASEDIVYEKLVSALDGTGHVILREEEIPVEWMTSNGTKVTGRPDIVICKAYASAPKGEWQGVVPINKNGLTVAAAVPVLGLELKSVHSVWVAREVLFNRKPKLSNLTQAAHYMWKLGEQVGMKYLPYKLVYTGYSQLGQGMAGDKDGWKVDGFPHPGEPGSEYIEYSYYEWSWKDVQNKKTGHFERKKSYKQLDHTAYLNLRESSRAHSIKHIKQFEIVYDLKFDEAGRLCYKLEHESEADWTRTIVTIEGIESFYEFVAGMADKKELGPRPAQVDTIGNKAGYKDCDYCPLKSTCDSHEKKGYKSWLDAVKDTTSRNNGVEIPARDEQTPEGTDKKSLLEHIVDGLLSRQ